MTQGGRKKLQGEEIQWRVVRCNDKIRLWSNGERNYDSDRGDKPTVFVVEVGDFFKSVGYGCRFPRVREILAGRS